MVTEEKLVREFQAIGVQPGMTLEVHSSLSSFGFVEEARIPSSAR